MCDINKGRAKVCKDSNGGLKNVYFVNEGEITGYTYDATNTDLIATVTGTPDAYKWALGKGANTYEETITTSDENGTTFFEGVLTLTFPKLTIVDNYQVKLLAAGNPSVIIEDNNGNFFLAGKLRGCSVTGGTLASGAAMGDLSGYTLVLTSQENAPLSFIDASTEADLTTAGFTIVTS